jgi:periplasmic copper chaperone A
MTFTADQTYSDATVAHWNEIAKPGAAEPEHPAPVLTLTAATADSGSASSSDGLARGLGIAGIVIGVTGLSAAGLALRRKSRAT